MDDFWYLQRGVWHREDGVRLVHWTDRSAWCVTRNGSDDRMDIEADSAFEAMDEVDRRWPVHP